MADNVTTTEVATQGQTGGEAPAKVEPTAVETSSDSVKWDQVDFSEADLESGSPQETVTEKPAVVSQPETQPGSTTPAPAAPQQQQVAPVVQPQVIQQPAALQQVQPQAPAQQLSQQPQASSQQQAATEEPQGSADPLTSFVQKLDANEDAVVQALTQQRYALDSATVEEIQTNPEVAIPKLMARTHVNVIKATIGFMAQQLPVLIDGLLTARNTHTQLEDKFYATWPQIDRTKHAAQVAQFSQMFRMMNPKASTEDAIKAIGAQIVVALGLPVQGQPAQQQQRAPAQPNAAPFMPAAVSTPPAPTQQNTPRNIFEMYDQMIAQEELEG